MILQAIVDTVEICARKGVKKVVISPGSRNAPITLAFARNPGIQSYVIPDERSAGFIALGIAQKSNEPVALVCTSGSAVYNYAPAVAEAFYSHTPLIVISADRPPEWIDQRDGQTIRQTGILDSHVLGSYSFPDSVNHPDQLWHAHRLVNDAVNLATSTKPGPVHINVPLREPFYPRQNDSFNPSENIRIVQSELPKSVLSKEQKENLQKELSTSKNVLIVAGQGHWPQGFIDQLDNVSNEHHLPVVSDIISNCTSLPQSILNQDLFLAGENDKRDQALKPDLLITFGQSVISKNLKLFIRKNKPIFHWHIDPSDEVADTFQSLTKVLHQNPEDFFKEFQSLNFSHSPEYAGHWKRYDNVGTTVLTHHVDGDFWELQAVAKILTHLATGTQLHLANSMPVRWANLINHQRKDLTVYANRGTSGIDGCLSAAVGCALSCTEPVVVILGDMSFFYDRNGLWHNHLPDNLRVIVLNNHGGGIFRLIEGPSNQPELDEYFETHQKLTAENSCKDFNIEYSKTESRQQLEGVLSNFLDTTGQAKLLEIQTDSKTNKALFSKLKTDIKEQLNKQQ